MGTTYPARSPTSSRLRAVTDEPEDAAEDAHTTSDADGEVEIEVTRGRAADRSIDSAREPDSDFDPDPNPSSDPDSDFNEPNRRAGTAYRSESDLADELGRIDVMTTPEGYVEGRIIDVATVDATTVRLAVSLPHGESVSFTLDKPIPWSDEFLLARLIEDVGYDAASIDHVVGEPVYLQRTDLEPEDDDWWAWSSAPTRADGWNALVSSLSGGRYRLERDVEPEWRLVDPLERPDTRADADESIDDLVGVGLVLLGTVLAALGAVVGATGGVVLSGAVVGYALVGLLVVLFGLAVLGRDESAD